MADVRGYEEVKGYRHDSLLIYVPTERHLYVKKESRRGCDEYICYQTILTDKKKLNIDAIPKCTSRIYIDTTSRQLVKRGKNHTVHDNHEMLFKDMSSKKSIVDACILLSKELNSLAVPIPMNNIFTREIATRSIGESNLRYDSMKRNLSRYAQEDKTPSNLNSPQAIAEAFKDPVMLQKYGMNLRGSAPFYVETNVDAPSFTMFASYEAINIIEEHIPPTERLYLMDGTFGIRPIGSFYQVLIIYIEYKNDVIPIIYALMSGKSTEAYQAVFNCIENKVFRMQPQRFMTDFESGLRKAINKVYPRAVLSGCWYHYSAALRRKMLSLGLKKTVDENAEAKSIYRKLLKLPLLPPNSIKDGYAIIVREAHEAKLLSSFNAFFIYFESYWIAMNERNSLSVWKLNMRTTSSLESFNAVLNRSINNRLNFIKFVQRLKFHECRKSERFHNLVTDAPHKFQYSRRNKNAQDRELKIKQCSTLLAEGKLSLKEFLGIVSYEKVFDSDGDSDCDDID